MIIGVAVDKVKWGFDGIYSYKVPSYLMEKVSLGDRVLVPFGKSNIKRLAVVMKIDAPQDIDDSELKEIYEVIDETPPLTAEMLFLAKYMKKSYYCTLFSAFKAMLPSDNSLLKIEKIIYVDEEKYVQLKDRLSLEETKMIQQVLNSENGILTGKKYKKFESQNQGLAGKLESLGIFKFRYAKETKESGRRDEALKLSENIDCRLTEKQKKVVDFLKERKASTVKEISYFTGITRGVINTLLKKGILEYFAENISNFNLNLSTENIKKRDDITLTYQQNRVYEELKCWAKKNEPHVSLLRGVTGSGKTMVLLSLIDFILEKGQDVIFMVPEIALTTQVISTFKSRYGEKVAAMHSKLSDKERRKEWHRIKEGEAKLVVGTRTSVFAPVKNLGLIIMDEEHETSYKSEATPRFHARDLAIQRCKYNKCTLVLASATPSVESYFLAKSGIYSLHTLEERYGNAVLPKTEIIDMNLELMNGNPTPFSEKLIKIIKEELGKGNQAVLLLNRRGYHTFVKCRDCKEPVICPNCNITLNYHKANNRLMCHYCGYSMEFLQECPRCHGMNMTYEGIGTQRAEFQLNELLPEAKIIRVDTDAVDPGGSSGKVFQEFLERKYDIMIGTQMIAKGFNFPNVTLVGVLMADQALYSDDFRSYERAFSLITQVVGRSGRGKYAGRAVIQTYTPENPVISLAAKQNYEDFYNDEIKIRKAMLYPPFSDICCVGFTGKKEKNVAEISKEFFEKLKEIAANEYRDIPLRIFKPSPANINKICGSYRYRILLKCRNGKKFYGMLSKIMLIYERKANSKHVNAFIDMNPSFIM